MSVTMLPKYTPEGALAGESAEVAAERLHRKKNKPANPADDLEFPAYQFFPYPTALYRKWDEDAREDEVYRVAGRLTLDLEKRRDRQIADRLVGDFETRNVGSIDFVRRGGERSNAIEVVSELRERNIREHQTLLEEGWSDTPGGVKEATRRVQIKLATAAAERQGEDMRLGEKAKAELEAIDDAAPDHVVNVAETRKQLQGEGKLPKERR